MIIQNEIERKLLEAFETQHLEVLNESEKHNVAPGSESHFKVTIVTDAFAGLRLIQRHRQVNELLADELKKDIHALALHTYTPQEWYEYYSEEPPPSPRCLGGSKREKASL
ncbi:BolA family protein [Algicola sagamiensis]|uniref:BolA family protein n=1 Tax=Algicola sagamiensis TaxID=163869 RepID=UPI000372B27F|nr:BolA/IbaG family iron-sulfur metabolism protein [Algicola sagamiensis]